MLRVRVGFVWLCPGQDLAMGHVALKKFNVLNCVFSCCLPVVLPQRDQPSVLK